MIFPLFFPTWVKNLCKQELPAFFVCRKAPLFTQVQAYIGNYRKEV